MASHTTRHPPAAAAGHQSSLRGRVACNWCHARRVRCDAYQGLPCSNCASSKQTCQLIESKRGKYVRTHTKSSPARRSRSSNVNGSLGFKPLAAAVPLMNLNAFSPSFFEPSTMAEFMAGTASHANSTHWAGDPSYLGSPRGSSETDRALTVKEGSEMLYARLSEFHMADGRSQRLETSRTVYLGESFPLTYVVHEVISLSSGGTDSSSGSPRLQYPVPPTVDDKAQNLGYDDRLEPEEIEWLKSRGALSLPERTISDRLVRTYFDSVHPAFPIFDRTEFSTSYNANKLSLLTLQAVYLLAVTLCEDDLIEEAGFVDRSAARKTFHKRVKALYDADYETDKVAVVTTLLLMSFCWNGSMDEKDMWHYTGSAIGLAQALGMHRSTINSDLSIKDQRMWRRIWWSLYVRDRHSAAGLGRPIRIRDDDCDVEMLQDSDFEETESSDPSIFGIQTRTHVLYAIHLAKLSVVFGQITLTKFGARKPSTPERDKAVLVAQLRAWSQNLPPELTHRGLDDSRDGAFWADMLDATYNHHLILLHRPDHGNIKAPRESSEGIAFSAANKITRIIDDMLTTETLRRAQLQICLSIFAALSMHAILIRRSVPMQRKLAENHARLCMLGLIELEKSWPACSWILRLFNSVLQNPIVGGDELSHTNIHKTIPTPETMTSKDFSSIGISSQSTTQDLSGAHQDHQSVAYSCPEQHINDIFQQLDPSLQMGLSSDTQTSFDQPDFQNPSLFAGIGSDFNAGNSEFLSYLMQQFPDG